MAALAIDLPCFGERQSTSESSLSNGHDGHGIYMTVPGLLPDLSTADVAALMIPRPHFCAVGELDGLTPSAAVKVAAEALTQSYRQAGASSAWQLLIEPGSGHVETVQMRREVLSFLEGQLLKSQG